MNDEWLTPERWNVRVRCPRCKQLFTSGDSFADSAAGGRACLECIARERAASSADHPTHRASERAWGWKREREHVYLTLAILAYYGIMLTVLPVLLFFALFHPGVHHGGGTEYGEILGLIIGVGAFAFTVGVFFAAVADGAAQESGSGSRTWLAFLVATLGPSLLAAICLSLAVGLWSLL